MSTVQPRDTTGWSPRNAAGVWLILALLVGAMLRISTYLGNRSLHLDEARLMLNVLERTPQQLLGPLDHGQTAPIGFLLIEKLVASLLGEAEWALRLVPFLAGLAALALTPLLARRWLGATETALATWLVALSQPLTYYGAEAKQYSSDVLLALLVVWATQRSLSRKQASMSSFTVIGVLALCCSQPAFFVCAAAAATLALWAWHTGQRVDRRRAAAALCVLGASAAALSWYVLQESRTTGFLRDFWARGFPPLPPRTLSDLAWPVQSFFGFFNDPAGFGSAGVAAVAFVLGCRVLLRERRDALGLCMLPALATLGAATLHLYPFATTLHTASYPIDGRVLLFLVPGAAIVVAAGLGSLLRDSQGKRAALGWTVGGLLLTSMAGEMAVQPVWRIRVHDLRPLVEFLAQHSQPHDSVMLNTRALPTFRYYLRRLPEALAARLSGATVELKGTCLWSTYEQQVLAMKPRTGHARLWLLYAHHPTWHSELDELFVAGVLDRIGQRQRLRRAAGASLQLYVLGVPTSSPAGGIGSP